MATTAHRVLEELASHFARDGWASTGAPARVLAMAKQPSEGVEHLLFISEPWDVTAPPVAGFALLACTINVHFPTLEACINEALGRDAMEAGRQSLRLPLARLAPAQHLVKGRGYAVTPDTPGTEGAGTRLLRADFDEFLEPVRRQLCRLDVLGRLPLPPPTVDSWTWQLRRAAYLHLHGDAASSQQFLAWLQAQAEQVLAEAAGQSEAAAVAGDEAAGRRPTVSALGAAAEALALAEALRRPRRKVIRLTKA